MSSTFSRESELRLTQRTADIPPPNRHPKSATPSNDPYRHQPSTSSTADSQAAFVTPTIRLTTASPGQSNRSGSPLTPRESARAKKLKPKRSKLSKPVQPQPSEKTAKISDDVHRVRRRPETSRSFNNYVDPADDPEIGEIVRVNDRAAKENPKEKESKDGEAKAGWWTRNVGRGRKDLKDKEPDAAHGRSKSPGRSKPLSRSVSGNGLTSPPSRPALRNLQRSQTQRPRSLDAGLMLSISTAAAPTGVSPLVASPDQLVPDSFPSNRVSWTGFPPENPDKAISSLPLPPRRHGPAKRSASISFGSGISFVASNLRDRSATEDKSGSLALRAMRSVRSLARLGPWAQLRNSDGKEQHEDKQEHEKKSKDKESKKEGRPSGTSFRTGSTSSTSTKSIGPLSPDFAPPARASLRTRHSTGPESILSGGSGSGRGSAMSTVRWDPDFLDAIRDQEREKERTERSDRRSSTNSIGIRRNSFDALSSGTSKNQGTASTERQTDLFTEGRKLSSLALPLEELQEPTSPSSPVIMPLPPPTPPTPRKSQSELQRAIVLAKFAETPPGPNESTWSLEAAPASPYLDDFVVPTYFQMTPRSHPRPLSEQLIGPDHDSDIAEEEDSLAALDAVSSDLASLLNRLDLESTPRGTHSFIADDFDEPSPSDRGSPLRRAANVALPTAFPVAKEPKLVKHDTLPRGSNRQVSLNSLRPYSQSRQPSKRASGSANAMTLHSVVPQPVLGRAKTPLPVAPSQPKKALGAVDLPPQFRPVGTLAKPKPSTLTARQLYVATVQGNLKQQSTKRTSSNGVTDVPALVSTLSRPVLQSLISTESLPTVKPRRSRIRLQKEASSRSSPGSVKTNKPNAHGPTRTTSASSPVPKPRWSSSNSGSTPGPSRAPSRTSFVTSAKEPVSSLPAARTTGHRRQSSSFVSVSSPAPARRHSRKSSSQSNDGQRPLSSMHRPQSASSSLDQDDAPPKESQRELQTIISSAGNTVQLATQSERSQVVRRSISHMPRNPGPPPNLSLAMNEAMAVSILDPSQPKRASIPVFTAFANGEPDAEGESTPMPTPSAEHAGKSFDFTALSQCSGSPRSSFMDQCDSASQTDDLGSDSDISLASADPYLPEIAELEKQDEGSVVPPCADDSTTHNLLESLLAEMTSDVVSTGDCASSDEECNEPRSEDECVNLSYIPKDEQPDTAFKFGDTSLISTTRPLNLRPRSHSLAYGDQDILTLSNIISPISEAKQLSEAVPRSTPSSVKPLPFSFDSVRSTVVRIAPVNSEDASTSAQRSKTRSIVRGHHGCSPGGVSFTGLSAFGDIRNKWEYGVYAAKGRLGVPAPASRRPHAQPAPEARITSVGDDTAPEDPLTHPHIAMMQPDDVSETLDDTFAFRRANARPSSVHSERSGFYFRSSPVHHSHHHSDPSGRSASKSTSVLPVTHSPLYHQHSYSTSSVDSVAEAPHDQSCHSVISQFSSTDLGRSGLSDKMFDSVDASRTSIAVSPPESVAGDRDSDCCLSFPNNISDSLQGTSVERSFTTASDHCTLLDGGHISSVSLDSLADASSDVSVVIARPIRATRARSTIIDLAVGVVLDTPPLSPSTGSSSGYSSGAQSSVDLVGPKIATQRSVDVSGHRGNPSPLAMPHLRPHVGAGKSASRHSSPLSFIETIEEEATPSSPAPPSFSFKPADPESDDDSIYVVDQDTDQDSDTTEWGNADGLTPVRRYHALRTVADQALEMSKRTWHDTAWSSHDLQTFYPPNSPNGMKAMLQHSQEAYGPLPLELRTRRVSLRARASPYGRTYSIHVSPSASQTSISSSTLQERSASLWESLTGTTPNAKLAAVSPSRSDVITLPNHAHQRVHSPERRTALDRSKRAENLLPRQVKPARLENGSPSRTVLMSANLSLRVSRPRPKGRVTSNTHAPAPATRRA
ncbi:hypothetical protein BKA62DRAFT_809511 [Auriculariales sp. MPI-PUGE-AT-0066]|nr:hypothetical protein BKA62DRAFT_809511 [Auriculariales sp. MPI-PUGE-AT-0066]